MSKPSPYCECHKWDQPGGICAYCTGYTDGWTTETTALRRERDARLVELVEALCLESYADLDWDAVVHEAGRAAVHYHAVRRERDALAAEFAKWRAARDGAVAELEREVECTRGVVEQLDALQTWKDRAFDELRRCEAWFVKRGASYEEHADKAADEELRTLWQQSMAVNRESICKVDSMRGALCCKDDDGAGKGVG